MSKSVGPSRLAALLLCFALSSLAAAPAQQSSERELEFHSIMPLGTEGLLLKPAGKPLYLMALAQHPALEGWHQQRVGRHLVLLDAEGRQVEFYPERVGFRISASAMPEKFLGIELFPVTARADTNAYLLNLRFRLLIFRGLNVRRIEPASVELIGMPAEVPYEERIYGLTFDVGRVPVEDRMVLEVLSPAGERLCKFHLDLL